MDQAETLNKMIELQRLIDVHKKKMQQDDHSSHDY